MDENDDAATVLAIDAGNSKTDVALADTRGRVLATGRGGPFRPHRTGSTQAVAGIAAVVDDVLRRGVPDGAPRPVADHVSACLANADLPPEFAALELAIVERGWGRSLAVHNDTFGLLRAGLDEPRGVAVVCGAGINGAGLLPDGRTVRFPAVGHISGDWGGGGNLWQEAMWWAARAEDGRGPDTVLREALPAYLGLPDMAHLIEAVHLGAVEEERCLELTPVLFAVAERGDPVAAAIVQRQAQEVVALAVAALRRLDLLIEPVDVVLGGGVLTAGHPQLMNEIDRLLGESAPGAVVRLVRTPPVVGAALLGLDHLDASPEAKSRLRAEAAATQP